MKDDTNKIALFDFCETLVDFQTADAFADFVVERRYHELNLCTRYLYQLLKRSYVLAVLWKFFPQWGVGKKLCLYRLKGLDKRVLEEEAKVFYQERIHPAIIMPVLNALIEKQKQGYEIVIVSGGYSIYLELFAKEHQIQYVLANDFRFDKDGHFEGRIQRGDCMYEKKCTYIKEFFGDERKTDEWYAYSDSKSDRWMLEMVGNPIVISHKVSQKWAENNHYKQIIWK